MVALVMAGFVVLSTFVPSVQACSMVAVLVHFTMFLFLSSEFLVILFADLFFGKILFLIFFCQFAKISGSLGFLHGHCLTLLARGKGGLQRERGHLPLRVEHHRFLQRGGRPLFCRPNQMRKWPPLSHRTHHEHVLGSINLHDGM